jgi:isoquinoline 1-oxidoreductase subunit alpha
MKDVMELSINGTAFQIESGGGTSLHWVIRDELGMTGAKYGCGVAQCGACSVMIDGVITRSCVTPIDGLSGRKITTMESTEHDEIGQRGVAAWIKRQVRRCGYLQSGQAIAATALLKQTAHRSDTEISAAMVNLSRCEAYTAIKAALLDVAGGQSIASQGHSNGSRSATAIVPWATLGPAEARGFVSMVAAMMRNVTASPRASAKESDNAESN